MGGGEVAQIKWGAVFTVVAKKTKAAGVGAENGIQQKHLTRMWYRSVCSLWTTEIISKACTYIQLTSYCRRAHVPLDKVSFNQGVNRVLQLPIRWPDDQCKDCTCFQTRGLG